MAQRRISFLEKITQPDLYAQLTDAIKAHRQAFIDKTCHLPVAAK